MQQWSVKWRLLKECLCVVLKVVFVLAKVCNNVKVSQGVRLKKWNEMTFVLCEWNEREWREMKFSASVKWSEMKLQPVKWSEMKLQKSLCISEMKCEVYRRKFVHFVFALAYKRVCSVKFCCVGYLWFIPKVCKRKEKEFVRRL